jgi:hypothetical protein
MDMLNVSIRIARELARATGETHYVVRDGAGYLPTQWLAVDDDVRFRCVANGDVEAVR